jgi:TonB family protein
MYLDLEDNKPDTPHLPEAFSMREGVLASLLAHALMVIAYLVTPAAVPKEAAAAAAFQPPKDPVQFVHMVPTVERRATPRAQPEFSDLDRRASTPEKAPEPKNTAPFSVGDTSEKVVGGKVEKPAGPETGTAPPNTTTAASPDLVAKAERPAPVAPSPPAGGGLSSSLRNLSRYLQDQNFDNQQGGLGDQLPDIQFDSKGVEFGPWLRRFVAEVKRNWYIPQSAMALSGKVVIQFFVLRNGTITELKVVGPSAIEAYNISAFNALKRSNPTQPLPPEYPDDRAFFTVTFHYEIRDSSIPSAGVAAPVPY